MRATALVLMVASGCAGLGYEIVWTQQSALWLGHESAAVLAVTAAFFGGLALGALTLSPRIERSASPARWYAGCEALIGLWSLALAFLMAPVTGALLKLIGAQPSATWHWSIAFTGIFLLLLPATAPMAATLPAMERVLAEQRRDGASIAFLYAGNTFGAVVGVLAAAFLLVPRVGLVRTAAVCAGLNLLCAVLATRLFAARQVSASPDDAPAPIPAASGAVLVLAATGLLGIGYEVLVVRVLSQVAENTVYTFAILLAVYLVGSAVGAALLSRWERDRLLLATGGACLLGMLGMANAEGIKRAVLSALGPSMPAALAAEVALGLIAFLLPAVAMGGLFSHLCSRAAVRGVSFGRALGVNTLGAAVAPPVFGVLLVPAVGTKFAVLLIAAAYLVLVSRQFWSRPMMWGAAAATVVCAVWAPSLAIVDIPAGGRLVSYREGAMASVSIVEDAGGAASLHINNRQQEGSTGTLFADARQALLPILLHAHPRRALFLGLGTGVTSSAAAGDSALTVDAVELLPEVIEASPYFTRLMHEGATDSRVHLMAADARRFVRASTERYDVIVADNFHPARSGSGALYTVEHFNAVRSRLTADGVFCQWLPLHQLDLATLRSIVRSFLAAFPRGWSILATNSLDTPVLGLVGRADDQRFDFGALQARLAGATVATLAANFDITDELALLGSFVAGPESLAHFAGDAPLNTDDRPVVAYRAPRITYAPDSQPRDRLIALLNELQIEPDELFSSGAGDEAGSSRLVAYWLARNRFIQAGRDVRPAADVRSMLSQVEAPLLEVLHLSPDFRPAYDPLLGMADALGHIDAPAARDLLSALAQAAPSRPEAAQMLRDLPAGP